MSVGVVEGRALLDLCYTEDVAATVRDFGDGIQASPERLGEIEDRLAALERLKRKYGAGTGNAGAGSTGLAQVIAFGEEVKGKLNELENRRIRLLEPPKSSLGHRQFCWIEFESGEAGSRKGKVGLRRVLQILIERESKAVLARGGVEGSDLLVCG